MTTEQSKHYRNEKETVKTLLRDYPANGKIGAKSLKHLLRESKRLFLQTKLAADALDETGKPLPKGYEWVADNAYVLTEKFSLLPSEFCFHKDLQRENQTVDPLPRYYLVFMKYMEFLERNGFAFDDSALAAFFSALFADETDSPRYQDLYSFPLLFKAAAVCRIAAVCRNLLADNLSQEKAGEKFCFYFSVLRKLDAYSFEKSFAYSETERYLAADPSGFYPKMTDSTKHSYRKRVMTLAAKAGLSETDFVRSIYEKARNGKTERTRHIGAYLFRPASCRYAYLYFTLLGLFTLGIVLGLCRYRLWAILLLFPVWEVVKTILDRLFARFVPVKVLPRLEIKELSDNDGVLTVITTLLTGEKNDEVHFRRLENTYLSCGMKNASFAILGDYGDAPHESAAADERILASAVERIQALIEKYGTHFYLFLRPRTYCRTQNAFIGYERKRGAVMQLVHFLKTGENAFLAHAAAMPYETAQNIRFVVTLDADTNLPPDAVKELVGTMLHPLNRPVIDAKRHCVSEGYGVLQPRVAPELAAAQKTPFSRIMCGVGGMEIYSFTGFDFYQSLFENANFCGKGILDVTAFEETVNRPSVSFAEDCVLSHDILEGERLRTALVSVPTVTDGFPKNLLSYFRRHHRWVRGDVQNLVYLRKTFRNGLGQEVRNPFSGLTKFKLFDNVRRESIPIFSLAVLLVCGALGHRAAVILSFFSLLYLLLPVLADVMRLVRTWSFSCAARRFFSKGVYAGIWQSFLRFLLGVSALPKNAFVTLDAMLRAFWRMTVSRKNMLEWVTAAQSDAQSDNGLLSYVQKNLAGAALGVLLFVFVPYGGLKLVGLMWFFFPATAFFCGRETRIPERKPLSEKQKSTLRTYAADLWKMYVNTVTPEDHFLPPDNLQLEPIPKIAHRTSPTNIGLYLASVLAARDFGFIDSGELYCRLNETLTSLEQMEKYKGHLFNWYNTQTLAVLEDRYVSAVDSGNLLACLIVVSEGVKAYAAEEVKLLDIVARTKTFVCATDLKVIYNSDRDLFVLGLTFDADGRASQTSYAFDMLMSEARTLSYIAVARRAVPSKHWVALARPLIGYGDRVGVASWTGTAFEYFMPSLFLPTVRSSLLYEALRFAFYAQRSRFAMFADGQKAWGISESGCYVFDGDQNYGYRAFGIPMLGYKRGLDKDLVIAPYAAFLMLTMNTSLPLENLAHLKNGGVYGKYGFYEAVDFTPERTENGRERVVKSYMAHHVGMSLMAAANALFDDCMVRRFMSEPYMRCAAELLEEKIPVDAVVRRVRPKARKAI